MIKRLTLGGGCFWCVEAVYSDMLGVVGAESGYMGGDEDQANYNAVCSGQSGHAEVVQITYDEDQVDMEELLEVFWVIHDPTTLNQQGADKGTQYRSVIYYADEQEKKIIEESIIQAQKNFAPSPIVTEVSPLAEYHVAEAYHQNYFKNNPTQGYCMAVVAPKVQKFKTTFKDMLK